MNENTAPLGDSQPDPLARFLADDDANPTATLDATPPSDAPGAPDAGTPSEPLAKPRIRWAGVLWGVVFVALGVLGILAATDPGFANAIGTLTFGSVSSLVLTGVIALGVLVVLLGLSGVLLRRARRRPPAAG